jgi:ABC-type bacteriocin/lantibiotic exporter with double-glycine peptidase domain
MNSRVLSDIHETFLYLFSIDHNKKALRKKLELYYLSNDISIRSFADLITETGAIADLAIFKNFIRKEDLFQVLKDLHYPILVFSRKHNNSPVILIRKAGKLYQYIITRDEILKVEGVEDDFTDHLITAGEFSDLNKEKDNIFVITCFPNESVFSPEVKEASDYLEPPTAMGRFFSLLSSEKTEITYIYIYAIISGIISLSLPLGIQSIISFISSGQITTSVVVLVGFIILGILLTGGLQIMQLTLVEHIQQRLFSRTAFEFAFRIPKIKIESVLNYYPPELMNRFFEVMTLQKGLANILLEFSAAILQIIFGLILLSFYHPSFIFFGLVLLSILALILRSTGPKGLKTSLYESKYKYQLVNWLEEIARAISTFKLAGYSNLPLEKTDYFVSNYLHARKKHFKVLVTQYVSFITFKTLITGGLLIMGCILLVEKKINIGQFVASEIIIILIMNAVEKVVLKLDTFYDVLTSIEKIGAVTDLPIEVPKGINFENVVKDKGLYLKIKNLRYKFPNEQDYILKGIDLEISAGERICLSGYNSSGKTTFINIVLGFLTSYEGVVTYNNISLRDVNKNSLISMIGDNVSQEDLFDGTILENISLGKSTVSLENILWAIDAVGLTDFIHSQPQGLNTFLLGGRMGISETTARKLIICRSIVARPKLLILEDFLLGMEKEQKMKLLNLLVGKEYNWTIIVVSNDPDIMKLCDNTVLMKDGKIVCKGPYEAICQEQDLKELTVI